MGYSSRRSFLSSRPQLESHLLREALLDALRSSLAPRLCRTSHDSQSCSLSVRLLYGPSSPHMAVRSLRAGLRTVSAPASLASSPVSGLLRALTTQLLHENGGTHDWGRERL